MPTKQDVKSMSMEDLTLWLAAKGQPRFRAGQVFRWLHKRMALDFSEMSDLPSSLRELLERECYITGVKIQKKLVSEVDDTVKYLYELPDGNRIEAVLMRHRHGLSLCVSTQVGCRMGCRFCASTLGGLVRNLTPSEMLDQVYMAQRDGGERVGNLVLMGIGEPLDNFENVLRFLELLSSGDGLNLSLRHVSLSTCGLVDKIRLLAEKRLGLTLSVSLHAADDTRRDSLMPVNRKWPVGELMAACEDYFAATGRRVSFEYALVDGVNDRDEDAVRLAALVGHRNCHVNLIPVNTVAETSYRRSGAQRVRRFRQLLEERGVTATVRRELGSDIAAACGQLRLQEITVTDSTL